MGDRVADVVWCALVGGVVPIVASRARRTSLIWAGGVAAVVGVGGDAGGKVAAAALVVLLLSIAVSARRSRVTAAVLGGVAVQALLRGPTYEPIWLAPLVGVIALGPLVLSARRTARPRERRMATRVAVGAIVIGAVLGLAAGSAALLARSDLQSGADAAISGLDQLRAGDTPAAAAQFEQGASAFAAASTMLEGPLSWGGRFIPVVGQHVAALRELSVAGEDLATSATATATTADYRSLTADNGVVDLTRVRALQSPVAEASTTISASLDSVADVNSPWLIGPVATELDRFDDRLTDIGEQTEISSTALAIVPSLLGGDHPRQYFVAFSTPAESRNGGGFIGAYGLLRADGGELDLIESGDLGALDPRRGIDSAYAFDPPPDWDERYGSYLVNLFLGNLGASPDWPTNADVAGQLFPQTPDGSAVDGAIYADPAALAGLLSLTGPITVPGIGRELDAANAEQFLLIDQYVEFGGDNDERGELLGDVAQATFDALTSRPLPGIDDLTTTLGPLVEAGHLRLSVFDPEPEEFLDRVGLSGTWAPSPGADVLSVRSANMFPNKIDAFLHREIDVVTTLDERAATVTSEVSVSLRNDSPPSGLPDYVIGNDVGLPTGTNRTMVTIHSPHALDAVRLDGQPVPVETQTEFGGPVYSVVVDLGPGQSRVLDYTLSSRSWSAWPYRLQVLSQPTANPDLMAVILTTPGSTPTPPLRTPLVGPVLVLADSGAPRS